MSDERDCEALAHNITQILFDADYPWAQRIKIVRGMLEKSEAGK